MAAALLAGVPYALGRLIGWPLPRHVSWHGLQQFLVSPLADDAIIKGLACVAWLLWAIFVLSLLIEVAAAVRGRPAPRLPAIAPFQALAAALVGATLITTTAAPQAGVRTFPLEHALAAHAVATAPLSVGQPGPELAPVAGMGPVVTLEARTTAGSAVDDAAATGPRVYRVVEGDDLWEIAARFLGIGERWPEIFELNAGKPQPDGQALTDPDLIKPGWVLLLPTNPGHAGGAPPSSHSHPSHPRHGRPASPSASPSASASPSTSASSRASAHPTHPVPQASPARPSPSASPSPSAQSSRPTPSTSSASPSPSASSSASVHASGPAPQGSPGSPSPSAIPSPSAPTARPAPPRSSASAHPGTHRRHGVAVSLPSGAIIGLSLAVTAGVALALSRLHRRRRREPAPVPGTAPAEPALSPALEAIRQAHLAGSLRQQDENTDASAGMPVPSFAMAPAGDEIPVRDGSSTEVVNVAARDDGEEKEVPLDLVSVPGTGLTGPGAADAIRAIAITLLARRARDQAEVILCGPEGRQLLAADGEPGTPEVPGLAVLSDAGDGLGRLEAEIIHRRRLLDAAGTDDLSAYRDANPDEPLPTILIIAPATTPEPARLASVLTLGQGLGIAGILAGPWPAGATCQVSGNGVVTRVSAPELRHLDGTQMYQLTPAEAAEILSTLAGASGDLAAAEAGQPRVLPAPVADPPGTAAAERTAHIAILGPFQLSIGDEPVTRGLRRKAAELLTYLAVHRDGATSGAILDALWQDTPAGRATPILHTATTNIRTILREATGATEAAFIVRATDQVRIDPHLVTADLWQFQDALASAAHAASDDERYASLQGAADLWRGDIGPAIDSPWIDEYRETLRRDAVDTLARLAELAESGDREQALAHLERAITIDRYQEALYRRIMRLQSDLGRPDAARRTYQLLESRLTEIEAEPDEITAQLLSKILHSDRRKRSRAGSG